MYAAGLYNFVYSTECCRQPLRQAPLSEVYKKTVLIACLLFEGASESSCRFSRPHAATVATVKGDVPRELIRQRCPSHAYSWVAQGFAADTEFRMEVRANEDCTPSLH